MLQLQAALVRGIVLSLIATGSAIGAALAQQPPLDTRALVAIGIATFFAGLASRLAEGGVDAVRQVQGRVLPSDVGPKP